MTPVASSACDRPGDLLVRRVGPVVIHAGKAVDLQIDPARRHERVRRCRGVGDRQNRPFQLQPDAGSGRRMRVRSGAVARAHHPTKLDAAAPLLENASVNPTSFSSHGRHASGRRRRPSRRRRRHVETLAHRHHRVGRLAVRLHGPAAVHPGARVGDARAARRHDDDGRGARRQHLRDHRDDSGLGDRAASSSG